MRFSINLAVGLLLCIGCSETEPHGQVSGRISFDGQPIVAGMVVFEPLEESGQPRYAPIREGEYGATGPAALAPGTYRVRITGSTELPKETASQVPEEMIDDFHGQLYPEEKVQQVLPPSWNADSDLTVDVKMGNNKFHFQGRRGEAPAVSTEN